MQCFKPGKFRRRTRVSLIAAATVAVLGVATAGPATASSFVYEMGATTTAPPPRNVGPAIPAAALNPYSTVYRPGHVSLRSDDVPIDGFTAMHSDQNGASTWGLLGLLSLGALGLTAACATKRWRTTLCSHRAPQPDNSCPESARLEMQRGKLVVKPPGSRFGCMFPVALGLRPVRLEGWA